MTVEQQKKYNYWQWRTLIVLMLGYAFYYFVRKNFSVVMPALEAELGITKVQLGLFLTLNGLIYGLSRFANGFLADRFSRRKLMSAGLFLSAAANAEHNFGMDRGDLIVSEAYADQGPTLKRIRPRAKGSASRINKRMSHITVVVAPRKEA